MTTTLIITEQIQLQRLTKLISLIQKSRKKEQAIMSAEYYYIFGNRDLRNMDLNKQYDVTLRLINRYNEEKIKYSNYGISAN